MLSNSMKPLHLMSRFLLLAIGLTSAVSTPAAGTDDLAGLNAEIAQFSKLERACPEGGAAGSYVACVKKQSEAGNCVATFFLARAFAGDYESAALKELKESPRESTRLAISSIKQGCSMVLDFIPPKPFKWQLGMSGEQVRNSMDGAPEEIIKSESETTYLESWIYPKAVLQFARSPASRKHVVLKSITEKQ